MGHTPRRIAVAVHAAALAAPAARSESGLIIRWRAVTFGPDGTRGDLAPDRGYRRGAA
jgi:hypothetical protein